MTGYGELRAYGDSKGEKSVVMAICLVTGKHYDDIHALCRLAGREDGKGFKSKLAYLKILTDLGFKLTPVRFSSKTMRTIEQEFKLRARGKYLVHSTGHIAAMIDARVLDWSVGRCKRVNWVIQVTGGF